MSSIPSIPYCSDDRITGKNREKIGKDSSWKPGKSRHASENANLPNPISWLCLPSANNQRLREQGNSALTSSVFREQQGFCARVYACFKLSPVHTSWECWKWQKCTANLTSQLKFSRQMFCKSWAQRLWIANFKSVTSNAIPAKKIGIPRKYDPG